MSSGGYQGNFVNPLDKHLQCPFCHYALRDPIQTICGHRLCSGCYKELIALRGVGDEIECPVDHSIMSAKDVFPDAFAKREVLNLQTYCKFRDSGCQWKGTLKEFENHIKKCDYEETVCPIGCMQAIPKRLLEKHLKENCPLRPVHCEYCNMVVPKSQLENHFETCQLYPIDCPSFCGEVKIARKDLQEHIDKFCQNAEGSCMFSFAGCKFKGSKKEIENHMKLEIFEHLKMSAKNAGVLEAKNAELNQKVETETRKVKQLERRLEDQGEVLVSTQQQLGKIQEELKALEKEVSLTKQRSEISEENLTLLDRKSGPNMIRDIDNLKLQTQQMEQKIERLIKSNEQAEPIRVQIYSNTGPVSMPSGRTTTTTNDELDKRADRIENQLALQDVQMAELNLKLNLLESTSYDGVLIWKIDNLQRRRQDAIMGKTPSLYSPPFYTSRFGYKMCARIYLNGDGQGKGSHMSLFFVVMRSEYDALLTWPFPCKITLKLLAQDGSSNVVESFRPDPNSSSFRRPTSDMNIASGCPMFVNQSKVTSGSFIQKDSIFVKVIVDTSTLPSF